jgi:hypothetical protein
VSPPRPPASAPDGPPRIIFNLFPLDGASGLGTQRTNKPACASTMSRLCDTYKTPITKCTACMNANAVSRGLLSVVSLPVSLPSGGPATAPAPPSKQQGWRARRASHLWHPVISRPAHAGCAPGGGLHTLRRADLLQVRIGAALGPRRMHSQGIGVPLSHALNSSTRASNILDTAGNTCCYCSPGWCASELQNGLRVGEHVMHPRVIWRAHTLTPPSPFFSAGGFRDCV